MYDCEDCRERLAGEERENGACIAVAFVGLAVSIVGVSVWGLLAIMVAFPLGWLIVYRKQQKLRGKRGVK